MKKINHKLVTYIYLSLFFLTSITNVHAQDRDSCRSIEFGFRFMPTITSLDMQTSTGETIHGNAVLGFGVGAVIGFNFSNHVGIQGEIMYSSINEKSYDGNLKRKVNVRYVNIPVLLSLNTDKSRAINLNVVAGPQLGLLVGSSITLSGSNDVNNKHPILAVRKNDFGLAYGAGIDFELNPSYTTHLGIGYRGVLGFRDISDNSQIITTEAYYILEQNRINTNSIYICLSILF